MVYPIIYRVLYIPGGAGFLPINSSISQFLIIFGVQKVVNFGSPQEAEYHAGAVGRATIQYASWASNDV